MNGAGKWKFTQEFMISTEKHVLIKNVSKRDEHEFAIMIFSSKDI